MNRGRLIVCLATLGVAVIGVVPSSAARSPDKVGFRWKAPPITTPRERTPRLVNYCHISSELGTYQASELEKMLAQWDVVILFPYAQIHERNLVSPDKIRSRNPKTRVLVWMPLQGPSGARWRRSISESNIGMWSGRDTSGKVVLAPWGEVLMNPVADQRAWPRYVVSFLDECLAAKADRYDGVMLDCLWPCPAFGIDANGDGRQDRLDVLRWQDSYVWMLRQLHEKYPLATLTGNAGYPMNDHDPYLELLNGCMHENALGNQWGPADWQRLWDGYQASVSISGEHDREAMHFIMVDVRMNRSLEAARGLDRLAAADLRRMRFGLCTSLLLDGGYFGFDRGDCLHGQLWWFDEYDANIGGPVAETQVGAIGTGLYSRQYEHGLVVVNPTDKPVLSDLAMEHFDYTTKKTARRLMIPSQDGRILKAESRMQ